MELFELNDYKVDIKPEVLLIPIFKKIFDRDKTKDKKNALEEISYIVFMCDSSSPYNNELSDDDKSDRIIKEIVSIKNWKPDAIVNEAMKFYKEKEETVTSKYFNSLKIGLSKVDKFIREFEVDGETTPLEMSQVNGMIKNSIETVKAIREVEKLVKEDKNSNNYLRGGREKGLFMDED